MSMNLIEFGGMIPALPGERLAAANATLAIDVDLTHNTLRPWRTPRLVGQAVAAPTFTLVNNGEVDIGDIDTTWVDQPLGCVEVYKANGKTGLLEWDGDGWQRVGIAAPTSTPLLTVAVRSEFDAEGVFARQYLFTWITADGRESAGSVPSNVIAAAPDDVATVTGFGTPPANARLLRLYAFVPETSDESTAAPDYALLSNYFSVGTYPASVQSINHAFAAGDALGEMFVTNGHEPPPANITSLTRTQVDQMAGIADDLIWFSVPKYPWAWPSKYTIAVPDKPLRVVADGEFAYVLTRGRPSVLTATHAANDSGVRKVVDITEGLPLIGRQSVASIDGAIIYASSRGFVRLKGPAHAHYELFNFEQWMALNPLSIRATAWRQYYVFTSDGGTYFVRFGEKPSVTMCSLNPAAVYTNQAGALFFLMPDGKLLEWAGGDDLLPYTWEKHFGVKWNRDAFTVVHVSREPDGEVSVKLTAGSLEKTIQVTQDGMHRVKPMPYNVRRSVRITGTAQVYQVTTAAIPGA